MLASLGMKIAAFFRFRKARETEAFVDQIDGASAMMTILTKAKLFPVPEISIDPGDKPPTSPALGSDRASTAVSTDQQTLVAPTASRSINSTSLTPSLAPPQLAPAQHLASLPPDLRAQAESLIMTQLTNYSVPIADFIYAKYPDADQMERQVVYEGYMRMYREQVEGEVVHMIWVGQEGVG
jgi:hypothetical protein